MMINIPKTDYNYSKKTVAGGTTGKMKSKWVNAFKNIKCGEQESR